jgi:hypothetical protein
MTKPGIPPGNDIRKGLIAVVLYIVKDTDGIDLLISSYYRPHLFPEKGYVVLFLDGFARFGSTKSSSLMIFPFDTALMILAISSGLTLG